MKSIYEYTPDSLIADLVETHASLKSCENDIFSAYNILVECFRCGGKLLVCGNGGSAADSEHITGELMKSFRFKRRIEPGFANAYRDVNGDEVPKWLEGALPTIPLGSHSALNTAFANDEASVGIYAQQVYGYGKAGDVLLGISTSGTSANVVEAAKVARAKGMKIIALTGMKKTFFSSIADAAIRAPETETFKVQECHLPIYHCLCSMVEVEMFGEPID